MTEYYPGNSLYAYRVKQWQKTRRFKVMRAVLTVLLVPVLPFVKSRRAEEMGLLVAIKLIGVQAAAYV